MPKPVETVFATIAGKPAIKTSKFNAVKSIAVFATPTNANFNLSMCLETIFTTLFRVLSRVYNGVFKKITGSDFPKSMTDFILINKKAKKHFSIFTERNRAYRYIIYGLGFKRDFVHYSPKERIAGKATYSFKSLRRLAVNIFVSQSPFLLYLFGYVGAIISALSFLAGLFIITEQWILRDPLGLKLAGYVSLGVFISFLCGLIMVALAMHALYINNINTEAMNRPIYIIDEERSKL
jgi:hypothetical protein